MASTRSRPYTATTRPRETAKEPSALAQIQQRGRRAPPPARAPRQVRALRAPPPARAPRERRVPRVPPLVGQRVGQREPPALPLARAPRERRVPQVRQQGRPPATIPPEQRALQDQRPQTIAPRVGTP